MVDHTIRTSLVLRIGLGFALGCVLGLGSYWLNTEIIILYVSRNVLKKIGKIIGLGFVYFGFKLGYLVIGLGLESR